MPGRGFFPSTAEATRKPYDIPPRGDRVIRANWRTSGLPRRYRPNGCNLSEDMPARNAAESPAGIPGPPGLFRPRRINDRPAGDGKLRMPAGSRWRGFDKHRLTLEPLAPCGLNCGLTAWRQATVRRAGAFRRSAPNQIFQQSGRRDSNSQHSAWKADALPLSYARKSTCSST